MLNTVAPVSLLQAEGISAPAKVVWMAAALVEEELSAAALARASGMTLPTVRRAPAMLAETEWAVGEDRRGSIGGPTVEMPPALVASREVGAAGKVLYGLLQLAPRWGQRRYIAAVKDLCALAGASYNTVTLAVKELVRCGWLRVVREHPGRPALYVLLDPDLHRQRFLMVLAKRRVSRAKHKGEALMREWLSVLVASELFADEAAPEWLVNPQTGEQLRFDRYYHAGVAWEYNGAQHYRATDWFPGDEEARVRRLRDYVKAGICFYRGVPLVVVHSADLTLEGMRRKIGCLLPLRDLGGWERGGYRLVLGYLEWRSQDYREHEAEWG
jgi:hypothetical protein